MRILLSLILSLSLIACGDNTATPSAADTATPAVSETQRLNKWLDEQYEEQLNFSPEQRTSLGDKQDYDKLDDYTIAGSIEQTDWLRQSVATMHKDFDYEQLTDDGKLSYDMWTYSLQQAESQLPYLNHSYIFGRGGPQTGLPTFLLTYHTVDTEADMVAYIARLREIKRVLGELLQRQQDAADAGIRQPAWAYDFALGEIARVTAGIPFNSNDNSPNSPLWVDVQTKVDGLRENNVIDAARAQALRDEARNVLTGDVLTAYESVRSWLEQDKPNADQEARGVWALPDGENYYNTRLKLMTTTDLTADEIHDIGLAEVARIHSEMEAIREQVDFEGTLQEFFVFVREDPQFYFPDTDEGRQAYLDMNIALIDAMRERLPEYFGILPKAQLEVRRVEAYREQPGAAQHYMPGSPDGSRPGIYYSHMSDMSGLAIDEVEDVAYHEGIPGHHMQISIQQELTDIPRFRTQYFTTAYVEGWGLYAEWLGKEMGGFTDPYADFGRLGGELWRAVRLVVDTGIHAKQWTQQQAIDYFLENSSVSESSVRSEIERYITGPGQATAYKIGMMNFQSARARAEAALGDKFDIRAFHDVVLGAGALPMPLMNARVDHWIETEREKGEKGSE